jgi:RNase H-fold protein (predicted Holliday junction resolvase)
LIDYQDERNTSKLAVENLIRKGTPKNKRTKEAIDQMSAILILQRYLNHF